MPSSINGWEVLGSPPWDDRRLTRLRVPGTPAVFYGRASVAPLFVAIALDYHSLVHPLVGKGDVDGYDYRQARAASSWSDHSSGTAMDIRAGAEGAQGRENFAWWDGAHAAAAREIKARFEIVMWGGAKDLGGDYGNPIYWDWMHWALKPGTTQADVNRVIAKLGIKPDGTRGPAPAPKPPAPKPPKPVPAPIVSVAAVLKGDVPSVKIVQAAINKATGAKLTVDGQWGPKTRNAYTAWQLSLGFRGKDADGMPGKKSLAALGARCGFTVKP